MKGQTKTRFENKESRRKEKVGSLKLTHYPNLGSFGNIHELKASLPIPLFSSAMLFENDDSRYLNSSCPIGFGIASPGA